MAEMASAAAMSGTARRTMSQPAAARAFICAQVASTSEVRVLHIDCTETSAPPPTAAPPTMMRFVFSLFMTSRSSQCRYT